MAHTKISIKFKVFPKKILHATDFHFNKSWFKFIKDIEPNFDVICITGDFIDVFDESGMAPHIYYRSIASLMVLLFILIVGGLMMFWLISELKLIIE